MTNDPKALIAAKFLDSFLREIVLDTAIHTHAKIKRARSICKLCGVRCQAHTPAAEQTATLSAAPGTAETTTPTSRSGTPVPGASSSKPDYYSNNPLFECLVCSRQVSSNRYATHLAKCMGMGSKGGRKGAARNAKATTSATTSSRQSGAATPRYGSDLDDDSFAKRKNGKNGTKRANSPLAASSVANARMNKRIKTSSPTPPPTDSLATATGGLNRSYSSQTFAPSGLSNSTVLTGSPLNPNNTPSTAKPLSASKSNGGTPKPFNGKASGANKRKRLIEDEDDDDDDDGDDGGGSYAAGSDGSGSGADTNAAEEEGEISDDDDDVALAAGGSARPANGAGGKIKVGSSSASKPRTFAMVIDSDDDSDTSLSQQRKSHAVSDDDEDDDDDVQVTGVHRGSAAGRAGVKKKSTHGSSGLQRERGSDGEFIDVESASEQSDADSF
ncbi:hypothetical protein PANT_22d00268 [Moesziomyces antarcticus T-34]|uniref:SAGA-associated factor 11 n=1 Tax=Pseudozyma antarctica (strain T-34) TaxID=1151754 RepID=M9LSJ9_PSEA3|nr:hypothetical protein PANT_22d00268 [Moesziomyces antarcticus T-34]